GVVSVRPPHLHRRSPVPLRRSHRRGAAPALLHRPPAGTSESVPVQTSPHHGWLTSHRHWIAGEERVAAGATALAVRTWTSSVQAYALRGANHARPLSRVIVGGDVLVRQPERRVAGVFAPSECIEIDGRHPDLRLLTHAPVED